MKWGLKFEMAVDDSGVKAGADEAGIKARMLAAHEFIIRSGRATICRIGIGALAIGHHTRPHDALRKPLAHTRTEGGHVLLPLAR